MKTLGFSCTGFTLSSGYCSARAAQPLYGSQQREPRVQFRSCLALTVVNFSQQIVFPPLLIFQKAAAGLSLCISARGREPPASQSTFCGRFWLWVQGVWPPHSCLCWPHSYRPPLTGCVDTASPLTPSPVLTVAAASRFLPGLSLC